MTSNLKEARYSLITSVVGPLKCNCTLVLCNRTKEAVLIDPGAEADKIVSMVEASGARVKYLLHTHAHFDHIGATGNLRSRWEAPVCLHREDQLLFQNLPMQGQMFGMSFEPAPVVEKEIQHEEMLEVGDLKLEVVHTPGHSPGSVCFRLQGEPVLFSGDTLFQGSVGRADLWGGDTRQLIQSIKHRLLTLDGDIQVWPGHGPGSKIGIEKISNPFLR